MQVSPLGPPRLHFVLPSIAPVSPRRVLVNTFPAVVVDRDKTARFEKSPNFAKRGFKIAQMVQHEGSGYAVKSCSAGIGRFKPSHDRRKRCALFAMDCY